MPQTLSDRFLDFCIDAVPDTWRVDLARAMGTLLGQFPILVYFYGLVGAENAWLDFAPLFGVPFVIAFVARTFSDGAAALMAAGLGALGTVPLIVFRDAGTWDGSLLGLTGALAGLLVLAAIRASLHWLCGGLVVAAGLAAYVYLAQDWPSLCFPTIVLAAVCAGCGARVLDGLPTRFNLSSIYVSPERTTRAGRAWRRVLCALLFSLPLAGAAAAIARDDRHAYAGGALLLGLGPAFVGWAADEEAPTWRAVLGSALVVAGLAFAALVQAYAWEGHLRGVEDLELIAHYLAPFWDRHATSAVILSVTFGLSAGLLAYARRRGKDPLLTLLPAFLLGGGITCMAGYEHFSKGYVATWLPPVDVPPVTAFVWLLGAGGLDLADRWLVHRSAETD